MSEKRKFGIRAAPLRAAISAAKKSSYRPYKIGACIAKGRRIISVASNHIRTHPLILTFQNDKVLGLHAEMRACKSADLDSLQGADIYVVRLRKDKSLAIARPCEVCQEFLASVGIRRVFYTDSDGSVNKLRIN